MYWTTFQLFLCDWMSNQGSLQMQRAALCFVCDVYLATDNGIELTCEWLSNKTYHTYLSALSNFETPNDNTNTVLLRHYSIMLVYNCLHIVYEIPLDMLIHSQIHAHNREHTVALKQPSIFDDCTSGLANVCIL